MQNDHFIGAKLSVQQNPEMVPFIFWRSRNLAENVQSSGQLQIPITHMQTLKQAAWTFIQTKFLNEDHVAGLFLRILRTSPRFFHAGNYSLQLWKFWQ